MKCECSIERPDDDRPGEFPRASRRARDPPHRRPLRLLLRDPDLRRRRPRTGPGPSRRLAPPRAGAPPRLGAQHQQLVRRPRLGRDPGLLLVRRGPLRRHGVRADLAVPEGSAALHPRALGAGGLLRDRPGLLPPAADGSAADAQRLHRRPEPPRRRRLVEHRRVRAEGHGSADQRAGRLPEPARRVGAVGSAGGPSLDAQLLGSAAWPGCTR